MAALPGQARLEVGDRQIQFKTRKDLLGLLKLKKTTSTMTQCFAKSFDLRLAFAGKCSTLKSFPAERQNQK